VTRLLLRQYLGLHTIESVQVSSDPRGKPILLNRWPEVQFSLTHSGDLALLAIAGRRALGIDIQVVRPIDILGVAKLCFSRDEYRIFESMASADRIGAFFRAWTKKESIIKAKGGYLTDDDLAECDMSTTAQATRWLTVPLQIDRGYEAAITFEGQASALTYWHVYPQCLRSDGSIRTVQAASVMCGDTNASACCQSLSDVSTGQPGGAACALR
jgi:4'-phosphopantetheinyl transferase